MRERQSVRSNASASTTSSSGSRRCVRVILLSNEEFNTFIEGKAKAQDVFNQVCEHLGLRETEYFGLAQQHDSEYHFVDLSTKLQRLTSRGWKSKGGDDGPIITFYFRVQFYVDHISLLKERLTRHLYYQQLRDNLLNYNQFLTEEQCFLLASYALQADHGNFTHEKHRERYFDPREYLPAWVVSRHGEQYIIESMPKMHRDLNQLTKYDAEKNFIKDVCVTPVAHNLHFYKLKKRKTDDLGTAWLGISAAGIEIYEERDQFKSLMSTFQWKNIGKLEFAKKKFEIRSEGSPECRKFTYYTGSQDRSKYLLALSRGTHLFQMANQPKLAEIRHLEAEDRRYKESYIYSEDRELSWESENSSVSRRSRRSPSTGAPSSGVLMKQRISMISSSSSNTTSGIVSDRMHASLDESEDDRAQEIMIDTPPLPGSTFGSTLNLVNSPHSWNSPQSISGLSPIRAISPSMYGNTIPSYPAGQSPLTVRMLPSTVVNSQTPSPNSRPPQTPSPQTYPPQAPSPAHPISRTSSGHSSHSQRSQKFSLPVSEIPKADTPPSEAVPSSLPADVSLHRVQLTPIMTVTSTPVSVASEMAAPLPPPDEYANPPPPPPAQFVHQQTEDSVSDEPSTQEQTPGSDPANATGLDANSTPPLTEDVMRRIFLSSEVMASAWARHVADQRRIAEKVVQQEQKERQLQVELRLFEHQKEEEKKHQLMAQMYSANPPPPYRSAPTVVPAADDTMMMYNPTPAASLPNQGAQFSQQRRYQNHSYVNMTPNIQSEEEMLLAAQMEFLRQQKDQKQQEEILQRQQAYEEQQRLQQQQQMHEEQQRLQKQQQLHEEQQRLQQQQQLHEEQQRLQQQQIHEEQQRLQQQQIHEEQQRLQQQQQQRLEEQQRLQQQQQRLEEQQRLQQQQRLEEQQRLQQQQQLLEEQQRLQQQQQLLEEQQRLEQQRLQQFHEQQLAQQLQHQLQIQQYQSQGLMQMYQQPTQTQKQQPATNYAPQSEQLIMNYPSYNNNLYIAHPSTVPNAPPYTEAPSYDALAQTSVTYSSPATAHRNVHNPVTSAEIQQPQVSLITSASVYQPPQYSMQVNPTSTTSEELVVLASVNQKCVNAACNMSHPQTSGAGVTPQSTTPTKSSRNDDVPATSQSSKGVANSVRSKHSPGDVTVARAESAKEPGQKKNFRLPQHINSCPIHRTASNIEEEIKSKNLSLPMLAALCKDTSLKESQCTCEPEDERRKSYAQPVSSRLYDPGNIVRPQSWHHENFNLDKEIQNYQTKQLNLLPHENGFDGAISDQEEGRPRSATWGFQADNAELSWPVNGGLIPTRLNSGGHSPNNSDTVPQKAGYVH